MSDFKRYNAPIDGSPSTIGEQIVEEAYWRKAIVDAKRDMYFMPLAEVKDMPRNSGKTMKANVYYPILDDRNISDEGIDAAGVLQAAFTGANPLMHFYINGVNISEGNANFPGQINGTDGGYDVGAPYYRENDPADPTGALRTAYLAAVAALRVSIVGTIDGGASDYATEVIATGATFDLGFSNLYGSSRDPGVITNKLPALSEGAGRVNRVGSTRVVVEGTIEQFGFFTEYTEDSIMFDTDAELMMHITTEMMHAAVEMTEDTLQRDLINSAGTVRLPSAAASKAAITDTAAGEVTYDDFVQLSITLDLNRTPKHTSVITGSRMIDTKTVNAARFMYVSPEAVPFLENMQDYQGNKALIDVRHYEGQTTTMNGEIGSLHNFRIIVNPEMQYEAAGGAAVVGTDYYDDGVNTSIFPMLVVGEDSFSTIGFMSDGKKRNTKFTIHHLKPGRDSVTLENPYGNMGLMSIRWWYGFLLKRPERIATMWTALPLTLA